MANPKNFVDLQRGFYNALSQGLGYSPSDPFQVIQPSPPLTGGDQADELLWNYLNNLPMDSLTQNMQLSPGNQFLANYQGVMSALKAAPNTFVSTVGKPCADAFDKAIKDGDAKPSPMGFRNWAMFGEWSPVAVSGASALAAALLDPVFAAQMNVLPYKPVGSEPVVFSTGYKTMMTLLKKAPSRSFKVSASDWNSDVSKTWASNSSSGFFGLWGGSSSSSTLSEKFASSGVSLQAHFQNVLPFMATPGDWYSSSAFGLAFNSPGRAPWDPEKPINWDKTFGKPDGNMQRFATTLLIAHKMDITVQSQATYSELEQSEIKRNEGSGLWPFYSSGSGSGSSTSASFNAAGNMVVKITSPLNVAVVIGGIVAPAAQYLGHEAQASKIIMSKFFG
ncbi:hypothetical protein [Paraherbaspirillum soli]|uniref:Uncharacterized protein n=1 Tax=Paraherbaspirillum soli TaxID=631222 RepID=A0ABW0M366_9BURK